MNILYLIGNGFDLAQGLKTSYQDFYKYLCKQTPKNRVEAQMIEHIKGEECEKWSDLEFALGQFTKDITDKDEFEEFYYDLCEQLRTYLIDQVKSYTPSKEIIDKYIKDLVRPDYYLSEREKLEYAAHFNRYTGERIVTIVSFNYTDVIDKCLDRYNNDRKLPSSGIPYQLRTIEKIHGTLGTPYLLMGVNDEKQIDNLEFAKDEGVLDYLVKPRSNYEIGTRIDERFFAYIKEAHLIVTMGLSFGETDNVWWEAIGDRLKRDNDLIILLFVYERDLPTDERRKQPIKRRVKRDFLTKCGINKDNQFAFESRIYVCVGYGLFSPNVHIYQDNRKGI